MNRAKEKPISHQPTKAGDKGTQPAIAAVLLLIFYHKTEWSVKR